MVAQGVMMNNFFPALEGQNPDDMHAAYPAAGQRDPRYPKFGLDNLRPNNQQNNPNMVVQDQIDEVPQEQEEAESQENIANNGSGVNPSHFYQPTNIHINSNNGSN